MKQKLKTLLNNGTLHFYSIIVLLAVFTYISIKAKGAIQRERRRQQITRDSLIKDSISFKHLTDSLDHVIWERQQHRQDMQSSHND